jgi:hypothetical protein
LNLLKAIVGAAKVNVLLLIDELGKSLEFAASIKALMTSTYCNKLLNCG